MTTPDTSNTSHDPIFQQEQQHLSETYATLSALERELTLHLEKIRQAAAQDKRTMAEELAPNFASYTDAMETYADFATVNRLIDTYNISQDVDAEKLAAVQTLLEQPYFAKIVLQFNPNQPPKELYIGNAGISDKSCRRLIVDWRSPVAGVYYNQEKGATSYQAHGRTIEVDLKLRRQFDIKKDRLLAYFDTTVAIQDSLLLASLSKRRSAHMQAITATIQQEQNIVIRHEDVACLLVRGIAGSGKTSVLMQRIAYLFYHKRGNLDPRDVFLISPNPVFGNYVNKVLPDLGERNPEILTWNDLVRSLLPADRGIGRTNVELGSLAQIDRALSSFEFRSSDFNDIISANICLISADQISKISTKFNNIPAGAHRVTLMREELTERMRKRLALRARSEEVHDELFSLTPSEQLQIFHETIDPQDEQELQRTALTFLEYRHADAFEAVERDAWINIDHLAQRLLKNNGLTSLEWLYFKMALTGLSNPSAQYVMVDEVQDYTPAQLVILARYFRQAHFLLLGDPNQAIAQGRATFDEIRELFLAACESVSERALMTSYRSAPEISTLFTSLLEPDERMQVSSVQREAEKPLIEIYRDAQEQKAVLHRIVAQARKNEGLTAIIAPHQHIAERLSTLWEKDAPLLIQENDVLPEQGIVLIPLKLAKGLEFDHVIVPDASERTFPCDPLARNRLYTTISRATRSLTLLAEGALTPLLTSSQTA